MSIDAAQEWREARDRLNQSGDDEANYGARFLENGGD